MSKEIKERIFELAECLSQNSEGKIRIAFNEENDNNTYEKEAAHFLKCNEKRLGRDLELYMFMAEVSSEQDVLVRLLEEVVLQIKDVPTAYKAAIEIVRDWGLEIYPENLHENWVDICK